MGASIYWEKAGTTAPTLRRVSAPSSFIDAMNRAFYDYPWTLCSDDVSRLQGMAAIFGGSDKDNPYLELVDLIEKFAALKVWPSW